MTHTHHTTTRTPGKHLTYEERIQIEVYKNEGYSNRQIALKIRCSRSTINNEIKRGTVRQIKQRQTAPSGKVYEYSTHIYSAEAAQYAYESARKNCGRASKWVELAEFMDWADDMMLNEAYSPAAVLAYAYNHNLFPELDLPCVTTLYHWIDRGIMRTKNIDLLEKTRRKPRRVKRDSPHETTLGKSINERPESVNNREEFGHWEIDTVIGAKDKGDKCLLTLVERQTRYEYLVLLDSKTQACVNQALSEFIGSFSETDQQLIFKSITSDNGKEFAGLSDLLSDQMDIYFAHPYTSWERGTSENQHKLIRRFIPKGQRMDSLTDETVKRIQQWMNVYPRALFGYQTAYDMFALRLNQTRRAA